MKRFKSSSLQTSPMKRNAVSRIDQPFTNMRSMISSSSVAPRSLTPSGSAAKTLSEFYNIKKLIHVKDELQEKFQTDNDNATTNFGTPMNNRSIMSKTRSNSVSKINSQTNLNQFLTPQSSRMTSPRRNDSDTNLLKLKSNIFKKTKKMKIDMDIYQFLKQDENFKLKLIKNTRDPIGSLYLGDKHDKQDIIQNLKEKEKQYDKQKMFLIDKIQQRRFQQDKADREKMYRQLIKQQQIKQAEEMKSDKIMLDNLVIGGFRKFSGQVNLYNLYFTGSIEEYDGYATKKALKVQSGYILPQKNLLQSENLPSQSSTTNNMHSRRPSQLLVSNNNNNNSGVGFSRDKLKIQISSKPSFYAQDKASNPPSTRSINTPNLVIKQIDSVKQESNLQSPGKVPSSNNLLASNQIKQTQLIENVIQQLQLNRIPSNQTQKNQTFSNIFSLNQQQSQTERIQSLKGVLKQRQQDLFNNNSSLQQVISPRTINFSNNNKSSNEYQLQAQKSNTQQQQQSSIQIKKEVNNAQEQTESTKSNIMKTAQQNEFISKQQMKSTDTLNQQQEVIPPRLQLQQHYQESDKIIEKSSEKNSPSSCLTARSPTLTLNLTNLKSDKAQTGRSHYFKRKQSRNNNQDEDQEQKEKHPIEKLDDMSDNFLIRLNSLKEFKIDEDFFSPVYDKYKKQISSIQSPRTQAQESFFMHVRHNQLEEIKEAILFNPLLLNAVDNYLYTAMHWAVKRNYENLARYLVEKGTDLTLKDYKNRTPYELAVELGYFNITKIINQ